MRITTRNLTAAAGPFDSYVHRFMDECTAADADVTSELIPPPERRRGADWSRIILEIDPTTLRLLAQYSAAVIATVKMSGYADAFFKAAAQKMGDMAGAKVGEALGALWERIAKHIRTPPRDSHPSVEFVLSIQTEGMPIEVSISGIESGTLRDLTTADVESLLSLRPVIYCLPSIVEEFGRQAERMGIELHSSATTMLWPTNHAHSSWCWQVELAPIARFCLDPCGILRAREPLPCFADVSETDARFLSERIGSTEIERIVRQFAACPRGIRPWF